MSEAYPGVDRLEAILRDIQISSYSTKHIGCRYLQFGAKLGRNIDFHGGVKRMGRVLTRGDRHPRHMRAKCRSLEDSRQV